MESLSKEAELALSYVNFTNKNIFLTGKAGTGKTTLLRHIKDTTHKKCAIVAPTGIAALNAKGVTIHSFFLLPLGGFVPSDLYIQSEVDRIETPFSLINGLKFRKDKKDIIRNLQLLIIDEVSMLRADILDEIDLVLRHIRRIDKLFGGVQILFIGDLEQLPPVVKNSEWNILRNYYNSMYFFNANCLKEEQPVYIELTKVYRQNEQLFIEILNNIRNKKLTDFDINILNTKVNPNFSIKTHPNTIVITTHNDKADDINTKALENIKEKTYTFTAEIVGDFPEKLYPMDRKLHLKKGAQVMFTKNDTSFEKKYFNGKIGIIDSINEGEIVVYCKDDNSFINVDKYTWENIRYSLNQHTKQIDETILGSFTHYPLKLAWAITVHKSQGLTFERAALDVNQVFVSGQLYVALSRLKSLDGLTLLSPISQDLIFDNKEIKNYSENKKSLSDLQNQLPENITQYCFEETINLFDWGNIVNNWKNLIEYLNRIKKNNHKEWTDKQFSIFLEIQNIAYKFTRELYKNINEQNISWLTNRYNKAFQYFFPILDKLYSEILANIQKNKNSKKAKELTENFLIIEDVVLTLILNMKRTKNILNELSNNNLNISKTLVQDADADSYRSTHLKNIKNNLSKHTLIDEGDDIDVEFYNKKKKQQPEKPSYLITFELLKQGESIENICEVRKIQKDTIYSHIAKLISEDKLLLSDFLSQDKINTIASVFTNPEDSLASIKEQLPDFEWYELRLFKSYLNKNTL